MQKEQDWILEVCQAADDLVTQGPGNTNLEVLESARLKMNDFLYYRKFREAEMMAYVIHLRHAGRNKEADFIEGISC